MANRELEDLLESDDELPYVYDEIADIPAYQNDNRFDSIDFPWIDDNKFLDQCLGEDDVTSQCSSLNKGEEVANNPVKAQNNKQKNKKLIKKGILHRQDIFCVKCIANISTDTTLLLWFIEFLMQKDMQSDFKFLRSCLVQDNLNVKSSLMKPCYDMETVTKSHKFEILIR